MTKSNTAENDVIAAIFHGTAFSWAAVGSLYVSLHTADPGEAGVQTTSECAYGSYARQAIVRDATGWDVAGSQASNDDLLQFPKCTSGSEVITHVGVGTTLASAGQLIYSGALDDELAVSLNIQPQFAANALVAQED